MWTSPLETCPTRPRRSNGSCGRCARRSTGIPLAFDPGSVRVRVINDAVEHPGVNATLAAAEVGEHREVQGVPGVGRGLGVWVRNREREDLDLAGAKGRRFFVRTSSSRASSAWRLWRAWGWGICFWRRPTRVVWKGGVTGTGTVTLCLHSVKLRHSGGTAEEVQNSSDPAQSKC